jgi:hypothetical protein
MLSPQLAGFVALMTTALLTLPSVSQGAQVCGCKRITNGRVNRITAIPPGVAPTCNPARQVLLCWPDQTSAGSVTEMTAGDGLQATPTNPITGTGTIAVDAPTCSLTTEKLLWDGSAFQCSADETGTSFGLVDQKIDPLAYTTASVADLVPVPNMQFASVDVGANQAVLMTFKVDTANDTHENTVVYAFTRRAPGAPVEDHVRLCDLTYHEFHETSVLDKATSMTCLDKPSPGTYTYEMLWRVTGGEGRTNNTYFTIVVLPKGG